MKVGLYDGLCVLSRGDTTELLSLSCDSTMKDKLSVGQDEVLTRESNWPVPWLGFSEKYVSVVEATLSATFYCGKNQVQLGISSFEQHCTFFFFSRGSLCLLLRCVLLSKFPSHQWAKHNDLTKGSRCLNLFFLLKMSLRSGVEISDCSSHEVI